MGWSSEDIPDQSGRTFVITGANSGIGLEAARTLAGRGAHVVMACRSEARARDAMEVIRESHAGASLELIVLDLADLSSVERFAEVFADRHPRLDVLVNNAGVMALPRRETADGFEMQLGINHLGHFALTARLFGRLATTPGSRVVTVSSTAHKMGKMDFGDLNWERGYGKWRAYGRSKLANLLFAFELDRRLRRHDVAVKSVACHPGYASTNLQLAGPEMEGSSVRKGVARFFNRVMAQSSEGGALPTLFAAVAPAVDGGDYVGPGGLWEIRGEPEKVDSNARSKDLAAAERLWSVSEELTGVRFDVSAAGSA